MKLTFHGAAKEVGRSCVEVNADRKKCFLDFGLKLTEQGTEYPVNLQNLSSTDAVFISHAHLDHTGALPLGDAQGLQCPIIATACTKEITKLLLKDAFKIGKITHQHLGYREEDIYKALSFMKRVQLKEEGTINGIEYEYFDAGHIPGSATIKLNIGGKKILYTGDINSQETRLLRPAQTDYGEVDTMIIESTYGDRPHPPRDKEEINFIKGIKQTLDNNGSALVPVFAVGRAQEILLILAKEKFGVPLYIDGMSVTATNIALNYPDALKTPDKLKSAFNKAKIVHGFKERKNLTDEQGIFLTTSGMLTGGPVISYLKKMYSNPDNSILLTGYQGEHTNGRLLLEKKQVFLDGWKTAVKCNVQKFDFSAHAGQEELKQLIRKTNPQKVIFNHGETESENTMSEWANAKGFDAYTPDLGDTILV